MITTQAELEAKLIELSPMLSEKFNVSRIGYFGSFARNEQTDASDIDILLEDDSISYAEVRDFLRERIDRKIDVVPRNMLRKEIAPAVLEDLRIVVDGKWVNEFELSGKTERTRRMKKHELYLMDMLASMKTIAEYVGGYDFESFRKDRLRIDAVQRHLITIGEAAGKVHQETRAKYPEIPWSKIIAFRNIVIHDYDEIHYEKAWKTIRDDLPRNIADLERILDTEAG